MNPSITAISVASASYLCYYSSKYSHIIDEQKAKLGELIINNVLKIYPKNFGTFLFKFGSHLPYFIQIKLLDIFISPGYIVHIAMRKLMIQQQIEKDIKNGVRQVLILGGGYDINSLYLSDKYHDVHFFELDLPITQKYKLLSLDRSNISINKNKNMHYIECDLSKDDLYTILSSHNYQFQHPSIVVAEGLTMYLEKTDVEKFLNILREKIMSHDSKLIISFSPSFSGSGYISTLVRKESGENYKCKIDLQNVPTFVNKCGYNIIEYITATSLQKQAGNINAYLYFKKNINQSCENYFILTPKYDFMIQTLECKNISKIIIDCKN